MRYFTTDHHNYDRIESTWVPIRDRLTEGKHIPYKPKSEEDYFPEDDYDPADETWVSIVDYRLNNVRRKKSELPRSEWVIRLNEDKEPEPPEAKITIYSALAESLATTGRDTAAHTKLDETLVHLQEMALSGRLAQDALPKLEQEIAAIRDRYARSADDNATWFMEKYFRMTINPEEEEDLEDLDIKHLSTP